MMTVPASGFERGKVKSMQRWYVAKTKPGREKSVALYIKEKWGIEVFLPTVRRPSGSKAATEPLFPTYLFCLVDDRPGVWPDIRWVPGLCYFLSAGQELVPVSEGLIAHLKQRIAWWNDGGFEPHFARGERVRVTGGPLAGLEGIFKRYVPARLRCQVLLEIIGRQSQVELPAEVLRNQSGYRGLALAT
jgi:transcription antitermination factor NusG